MKVEKYTCCKCGKEFYLVMSDNEIMENPLCLDCVKEISSDNIIVRKLNKRRLESDKTYEVITLFGYKKPIEKLFDDYLIRKVIK